MGTEVINNGYLTILNIEVLRMGALNFVDFRKIFKCCFDFDMGCLCTYLSIAIKLLTLGS